MQPEASTIKVTWYGAPLSTTGESQGQKSAVANAGTGAIHSHLGMTFLTSAKEQARSIPTGKVTAAMSSVSEFIAL
jgi:hypothetical protein